MLEGLKASAGSVIPPRNLRGVSTKDKARSVWGRLRKRDVSPEVILSAILGVAMCHEDDPQQGKVEYRRVQIAKLLSRMGGGEVKRWPTHFTDPGSAQGDGLRSFPASEGRVLRELGKAAETAADFLLQDHIEDLLAAHRERQWRCTVESPVSDTTIDPIALTFVAAMEIQWRRTGNQSSDALRKVWYRMAQTYMDAIRENLSPNRVVIGRPSWLVLAPEMGVGKTIGAHVFLGLMARARPSFGFGGLFACRTIKQCEEAVTQINEHAGFEAAITRHSENSVSLEEAHEALRPRHHACRAGRT